MRAYRAVDPAKAEIIAVGSELLTPDRMDTNSLYLTAKLNEVGFRVHLKTIVGDAEEEIARVVEAAVSRSDLVVLIGGLGPTEDDRTRQTVARVLGRKLEPDATVLETMRRRFAVRGIAMPRINERQAQVIEGATVLVNTLGTAPGQWVEDRGVVIVLLPGPPRELQALFAQEVQPRLASAADRARLERRSLHVVGLSESEVDSIIAPIYTGCDGIETTVLASSAQISIHLHQWLQPGESPGAINELSARLREKLGDTVYSDAGEPLEQVVGQQLRRTGNTLAVAESCTSGMLGMRITRVPGSSDYFLGGVLCYSNEAKTSLCGVPAELIERHGAVSLEVAEALACGVRNALKSSIGLAVTGIAGPGGGSPEKPVGLVHLGLAHRGGAMHERRVIPGDRDSIRERASTYALAMLRRFLIT